MSTDTTVSPLRQRMIEDMAARKLGRHAQRSHIHSCRRFAAFLGRSPDTATADDVRRFQLHLVESGLSICNRNRIMTGVRFLFRVTLRRHDLAAEVYHLKEPQKLPLVMSPADPAAELPGIAVTCDAEITLVGAAGARTIRAGEFFTGPLSTVRQTDEIITELHLPFWPEHRRWAFQEFAQRQGDFAVAGIALFYDQDRHGRVRDAHIGVIGACNRPQRLRKVEVLLNGRTVDEDLIREAAAAAAQTIDPPEDFHAGVAYRRALVATLVERSLRTAAQARG